MTADLEKVWIGDLLKNVINAEVFLDYVIGTMLFLQQSPVCKLMISMVICKITICTAHSTLNSKCEQASDVWHEPTAIVASSRKWLLSFNPTWIGCSWKLCLGMVGLSFNSEFDRGLFTN